MKILDWAETKEDEPDERQRELEWEWGKATWGPFKCIRVLALMRIHKDITKAVKEKRWKDADELGTKFEWTKELPDRHFARMHTEAQSRPDTEAQSRPAAHFAGLPTPRGIVYSPHTIDEYVENPVEKMMRVMQDHYLHHTGKTETTRPPKRPWWHGDGSSNKKGNFGPRHGQAEGEPDPTRHGQPRPDIRPDIQAFHPASLVIDSNGVIHGYWQSNGVIH